MMILPRTEHVVVIVAVGVLTWLWWSRGEALEQVEHQRTVIANYELQVVNVQAEADRKARAYQDALRKAENEAKAQRSRAEWLKRQQGKGCADAEKLLDEYRSRA